MNRRDDFPLSHSLSFAFSLFCLALLHISPSLSLCISLPLALTLSEFSESLHPALIALLDNCLGQLVKTAAYRLIFGAPMLAQVCHSAAVLYASLSRSKSVLLQHSCPEVTLCPLKFN